ncbi:MAG: hypothetical protein ABNG98_02565 [Flavobacterium sp.]|jgi:hypothetical protein
MKTYILLFVFLSCIACEKSEPKESKIKSVQPIIELNKVNWNTKEGEEYSFRELLIDSVIENKELRSLKQNELLNVLGEPNRMENNHLYYTISQKKLGFWPLNQKTLVIKYSESDTITWIKIHE